MISVAYFDQLLRAASYTDISYDDKLYYDRFQRKSRYRLFWWNLLKSYLTTFFVAIKIFDCNIFYHFLVSNYKTFVFYRKLLNYQLLQRKQDRFTTCFKICGTNSWVFQKV